jgi:UDP-N-acetylmuramoyl-tripeptide--D-alanyl-D-alanine ligase
LDSRWFGLAQPLLLAAGAGGWLLFAARLLRRSLHILQLESYLTARLLRWWLRRPTRLLSVPRWAAVALAGLLALAGTRREPLWRLATASWAGLGGWLAWSERAPVEKKPLVLTARARRLIGGQAVVVLTGAWLAARLGGRHGGAPAAVLALTLAAPAAPLLTAAANLLLYPVEETLRRYYLHDASRKLARLGPLVVAVAGSYGKTSTKEFIATVLGARFEVLKPPGSHNTPMGLSRVIRDQLAPRHEVFVAELGDWVPGDIALLCRLLRPKIGVLTTIGPEHLERFKSMERIEASKFELLAALPADGTAIVNQDDEVIRRLAERTPRARLYRYGLAAAGAQVRARDVRTTRDGLEFVVEVDGHEPAAFKVGVLGRHNVANLLAAVAVGLTLGMSLEEIARAAARITPVEHRLQPIQGAGGVLVVDDAFNSNPRGAAAALEVLAELEGGRRILVTPGMVELAEREYEENRAFARQAAAVCDEVVLVGRSRAEPLLAGLRDARFPPDQVHVVGDLQAATACLATLVRAGDVVLFENDLPDTYADPG